MEGDFEGELHDLDADRQQGDDDDDGEEGDEDRLDQQMGDTGDNDQVCNCVYDQVHIISVWTVRCGLLFGWCVVWVAGWVLGV